MSVVQGCACPSDAVSCHYYLGSGKEEKAWSSMPLVTGCAPWSHRQHPVTAAVI